MTRYIKKARRVGGTMVVSIPKEIVEHLGIKEQDFLEVILEKVNEK